MRQSLEHEPPVLRPYFFSGRGWLHVLRTQYGADLRGLTLQEPEKLPDIEWPEVQEKKRPRKFPWVRQHVRVAQHPSEPGFSFDNFPEFFDGKTYLYCLIEQYGENLEDLSPEAVHALPILDPPFPRDYHDNRSHLKEYSPAESIDLQRRSHAFLERPIVYFPEEN